jgi:hypothetical protein
MSLRTLGGTGTGRGGPAIGSTRDLVRGAGIADDPARAVADQAEPVSDAAEPGDSGGFAPLRLSERDRQRLELAAGLTVDGAPQVRHWTSAGVRGGIAPEPGALAD